MEPDYYKVIVQLRLKGGRAKGRAGGRTPPIEGIHANAQGWERP